MLEYGYINENGYMTSKILEPITETRRDENEELKEYVVTVEEQAAFLYDRGWKPVEIIDDTKLTTEEGSYYSVRIVPYDAGDKISYKYEQKFNIRIVQKKISDLKNSLTSNDSNIGDYRITKCYEASLMGAEMPYDIYELHQKRQRVRDEINTLEELISSKM